MSLFITAIRFITDNNFTHAFRLRLTYLFYPIFQIEKSFAIGNRIDKNNSCGSFIIGLSDGFKPLLPGSIPDLHFNFNAINVKCFDLKIDTNGSNMGHLILLVNIAQQNIGFSYCWIADDDYLNEIIVFLLLASSSHWLLQLIWYWLLMIYSIIK